MTRNNLSAEEAIKRIDSQMNSEERCKHASHILCNSRSFDQLEADTHRLFQDLTGSDK
jgi:dephospho-CoA kinase